MINVFKREGHYTENVIFDIFVFYLTDRHISKF